MTKIFCDIANIHLIKQFSKKIQELRKKRLVYLTNLLEFKLKFIFSTDLSTLFS